MSLNEKVINYKILDLVILYNFDIKFDFNRNHMKSYGLFYAKLFLGAGHTITRPPKNIFLRTGDTITRLPLEIPPFTRTGGDVAASRNAIFRGGC
jgi:hypothetical protein